MGRRVAIDPVWCEQAARDGKSNQQMADELGVGYSTLGKFLTENPDVRNAMRDSRAQKKSGG